MTQGQRVRELRKALDLTLEKFGNSLGVGKTAISKIEKGENNLTEQMAKAICREFRVNYFWLTEGKGEMFSGTPQDVVDVLAKAAKETAEEPAFQDALQKLNLNYAWLDAASFQTQISEQEKYFDELLTRLGLKK